MHNHRKRTKPEQLSPYQAALAGVKVFFGGGGSPFRESAKVRGIKEISEPIWFGSMGRPRTEAPSKGVHLGSPLDSAKKEKKGGGGVKGNFGGNLALLSGGDPGKKQAWRNRVQGRGGLL